MKPLKQRAKKRLIEAKTSELNDFLGEVLEGFYMVLFDQANQDDYTVDFEDFNRWYMARAEHHNLERKGRKIVKADLEYFYNTFKPLETPFKVSVPVFSFINNIIKN